MSPARCAAAALTGIALLTLGACAGSAGSGGPADRTAIAAQATPAGIAPELVLVTDIDGFELNPQLVGVMGGDGMSAGYARGASRVLLMTWREGDPAPVSDPSLVLCSDLPDADQPVLRCAAEHGGVHVVLEGEEVEAGALRAAAAALRVPRADELEELFSNIPKDHVERGDLPEVGDGAPINEPGAGG